MSLRWNGSVLGSPSQLARGAWSLQAHCVERQLNRWHVPLPVSSNLILHIDASRADTVSLNGTNVSAITDLSPSAQTIDQTTAANQPAYILREKNDRNVIRFTGSSNHFLNVTSITIPASYTTFRVMQRTASGQHSHGLGNNSASPNERYDAYWYSDNNTYQKSNANATTHGTASSLIGWFYITTRRNGTAQIRVRRNGSTIADVTSGTGVTNAASGSWIYIGAGHDGGLLRYTTGDIGELIVYDTSLSDTDVDSVEAYLAAKWRF